MLYLMLNPRGKSMRTTLNIDDELLAKASKLMGPMDRTAILSESLKALDTSVTCAVATLGLSPCLSVQPW